MSDTSEYAAGIIHEPGTDGPTAFSVAPDRGGYRISWSDDPLDFIWQSSAQMDDLIARIDEAFAQGEAK